MGCTASCKSCEGVAQNYSVDIGAPDEKDPDEVNEENEGEENPAELYKEKASRTFQLRSDTMMTLHRTGSEACTSQMTSDAFKINGDATEIIKHFYQEAVESMSLMHVEAYDLRLEHLQAMAQRLGFSDLKEGELKRLYESIDANADGNVTFWEFARAVADGPAAHTLQNFVTRFRCGLDCGFVTAPSYDYSKPTCDNYCEDALKFYGSFRKIRELRDYSYHVNYTKARQGWQDEAIKSVISRAVEQPAPWLVYTCGPMGVGKGYTLSWMSQHGFFPLENIVHIDPDAFKMMMPEWPDYVARDRDCAGTMCHKESSFMVEVAQAAAMEKRQNIWVDGSLRDATFYEQVFRRIRHTHPHYRISIFYINASEQAIRQRIKVRAEQTGRDVPEHLIVASLQAMDKSLNTLTPLCDFVARINNEGHEPTLVAFETVDTKGNWRVISDRFARTYHDPSAFPQSKPTQRLALLDTRLASAVVLNKQEKQHVSSQLTVSLDSLAEGKGVAEIFGSSILLSGSQRHDVVWHRNSKLPIPKEATGCLWIYPCRAVAESFTHHWQRCERLADETLKHLGHLMLYGGFAFFHKDSICAIYAVTTTESKQRLQFGKPITLKATAIEGARFQDIVSPYFFKQGALKFCWLSPGEKVPGLEKHCDEGAFAYMMDDECTILAFPVV
eukprot:symbB.v1.2.003196.t1/scaffold158.1/size292703/9